MRRLLEFEVGGVKYRADTMSARQQFHVARRLSAMAAAPLALIGNDDHQVQEQGPKLDPVEVGTSMLTAISTLPDVEADYVINACLASVRRNDSGTWSAIYANGVDLYDLPLHEVSMVVWHVLKGNLQGFFAALPPELRSVVTEGIGSVSRMARAGSSDQPSEE